MFLRHWSPEEHKYYPARLKEAAKLLLLAAACNPGSASPRDTGDACNSLQCQLCSTQYCITVSVIDVASKVEQQSTLVQCICGGSAGMPFVTNALTGRVPASCCVEA